MGREMFFDGVGLFFVVKDFVFYQIYLGKNLIIDFSVYFNNNLIYNIILKGRLDDDINVIRFIFGYFFGEFKVYDVNDNVLVLKIDLFVVKWEYFKRLEVFFQDSKYMG